MQIVTISSKYQVVIPKEIRKALNLSPGDKLQVFCYQNRLNFVTLKNIKKLRGSLRGIDTMIVRDIDHIN